MNDVREHVALFVEPARQGVVSWNTRTSNGRIDVRLLRAHQPATPWLELAQWNPSGRRSLSSEAEGVRIEVDVLHAEQLFDGVEVRAQGVAFSGVSLATPEHNKRSERATMTESLLDVPRRSQYVVANERGWCSAATMAMLCAFAGIERSVAQVAQGTFDGAYNGTGNWAFNVAFAGSLGLFACVAYLRNFEHAARLLERGVPIGLSYGWEPGELRGAPIPSSDGHLAVLCGFDAHGDCIVNDPAAPDVRCVYPREQLEALWLRNLGVAYIVARTDAIVKDILYSP